MKEEEGFTRKRKLKKYWKKFERKISEASRSNEMSPRGREKKFGIRKKEVKEGRERKRKKKTEMERVKWNHLGVKRRNLRGSERAKRNKQEALVRGPNYYRKESTPRREEENRKGRS